MEFYVKELEMDYNNVFYEQKKENILNFIKICNYCSINSKK